MAATASMDVAIVGAGAAGLTAAYDLIQNGNNLRVKILEARDRFGGRVKELEDFAVLDSTGNRSSNSSSIPIDLGGEWLHGDPSMLDEIAGFAVNVETIDWRPYSYRYNQDDDSWWSRLWFTTDDHKFVNSTWYDFFDTHIATPAVKEQIVYDCAVVTVDYSTAPVVLECADGRTWTAQQVILTVPVPILQQDITFIPPLPDSHRQAIDNLDILAGLKVILKFQEKFYYDAFTIEPWDFAAESGRFFYNPFDNQPHDNADSKNILTIDISGLFAEQYIDLEDDEIVQIMIQDLDAVFGGNNASTHLLDSFVQNWSARNYTRGVFSGSNWRSIMTLREPVEGVIVFAGEAIPYRDFDWGYVHGAAFSGRAAADLITVTASPTVSPSMMSDNNSTTTSASIIMAGRTGEWP
ncbi:Peroxisomal N(1)-acetyl-spermine/spermidine oxidase [Seminavis robusta]|uniref:Peroxisomal N(1)-acetyl-spermine/spermidine oxidase n=1 Tax=Seminavis robusta TaxID=568900 RepID=A0A9N8EC23_9STRA|nr:Peroxisomal N(1)-acetyl-spermine/spermidine oxidase [Seminavis robusta]|eukprot:Sro729_g193910.1 Peroxisomal N(1)-acetyl-spermine/spermidine oxidase (409) ;mRNA; r:45429-46655